MKVLTVKTLETISPEVQLDVHYILKMEQHADYVFKDRKANQYSATITLKDTSEAISKIVDCSAKIPEYTIVMDNLDMEENRIERITVQNGEIKEKKQGSWEWDG